MSTLVCARATPGTNVRDSRATIGATRNRLERERCFDMLTPPMVRTGSPRLLPTLRGCRDSDKGREPEHGGALFAVERQEHPVEIGSTISEESPAVPILAHGVEVEPRREDRVSAAARFGDLLARLIGDERRPVEVD